MITLNLGGVGLGLGRGVPDLTGFGCSFSGLTCLVACFDSLNICVQFLTLEFFGLCVFGNVFFGK